MSLDVSTPGATLSRTKRERRRLIGMGVIRAVTITVVLVTLYYALPLDRWSSSAIGLYLAVGVAVLAGMIVWQERSIVRSKYPAIRATEAFAATIPLFLLLFATSYYVLGQHDPAEFSEVLTRTDALYFTITVFSTVGFGDITPRMETARLVVSTQMLLDLVILGVVVRVLLSAVQRGRVKQDERDKVS